MPGPTPDTTHSPLPADYASASAIDVAVAVAEYGDQQLAEVMAQEKTGKISSERADRQIRVLSDMGSRALRLAELSEVQTGEDLRRELIDESRRLRRMDDRDFLPSDPLRDRRYREELARQMDRLGPMTLPRLRELGKGVVNAANANAEPETPPASASQPAAAETAEQDAFMQELIHTSNELGGTGLYGDVRYKGLGDLIAGNSLRRHKRTPGGSVVLAAWTEVPERPVREAFGQDPSPENVLAEAVAFTPTTETVVVVTKEAVPGSLFKRAQPRQSHNEVQQKYVDGPNGRERSIIIFWQYLPSWMGKAGEEAVNTRRYDESAGGRPGGHHAFALEVPESMAERFKAHIEADPTFPRRIGDALVQAHAPEPYKEAWNTEKKAAQEGTDLGHNNRFYPTYATLKEGAQLHVFDGRGSSDFEHPEYGHSAIPLPTAQAA